MEFFLFKDLLIILGFSIFVLLLGYRLHIPPVVGFILTGVLAGPHGLGLVGKSNDVEMLAQLGIVLLLFGIGMEFSLKKLFQIRRQFLLGGSLQVGLTILVCIGIGKLLKISWEESIFFGCLLSMSSTAIIKGILDQKGESHSPHGKLSIAILIFQDMIAIPMLLMIPLLGNNGNIASVNDTSLLWPILKGLGILGFVFFCAQLIVPRIFLLVTRTRNKELFLVTVFALCFSVAWLSAVLGLSLTLGAFMAGLIISESEYRNEAFSNIFPFQALFISFFFISVGMLLDLDFVFHQPQWIFLLAIAIFIIKLTTVTLTTVLLGLPIRTAVLVGIGLSQIGEFSFVLAKIGVPHGLGSDYSYQLFLAASLCTLLMSPVLINFSPAIAAWISSFPLPQKLKTGFGRNASDHPQQMENHVIIVGFGLSGRTVANACKLADIPYTILEMNPDTVKEEKKMGEPIHFGDATHLSVLEHIHFHQAKAIAILVNDANAARNIVKIAREANPAIYVIVRTRYMQDIDLMNNLGADEVVPDEFGSSIEVFSKILRQYHVPDEEMDSFVREIREKTYAHFVHHGIINSKLSDLKWDLSQVEVISSRLKPDGILVGKTLFDSQLRTVYGLSVLLIKRGAEILSNPAAETLLAVNDVLVMVRNQDSRISTDELFGFQKPEQTVGGNG